MKPTQLEIEPRWTGTREVMTMAGPIVISALSFVAMDFADKLMVAQLGTENLAAIGSASIWSYILGTIILGVVGCVSTFVSQSIGRGNPTRAGSYTWQAFYVSLAAGILAMLLWPLSGSLFALMGHSEASTKLEIAYFNVRLLGYLPMAWGTALIAFYQGINRPAVTMYVVVVANFTNIVLNYGLIYGKLGMPQLGIAGAAWGTIASQYVQAILMQILFLLPATDKTYHTRNTWAFNAHRFWELIRIGGPAGVSMMLDVAIWGIFISFVVGRFGDKALAANNAALSIMHISFVPAIALNQAIAPIVGQWIGRGDIARAKARTFTALKIGGGYMLVAGIFFAIFGAPIIEIFNNDPEVVMLGWQLLVIAAVFQLSDSTQIVLMGALRGVGDTRWVMMATLVGAYCCFLPLACFLALVYPGGPFWAWVGASIYIIGLSFTLMWRFLGERWRHIQIFAEDKAAPRTDMTLAEQPAE
jgi:MATE family multidrug resistance protein